MNKSTIIVAAGSGRRMGSDVPKQFLLLDGMPVLMHTIKRFHEYDAKAFIIVVLSASETETWQQLIKKYSFSIPHSIVTGGETRYQSVKNALAALPMHCIIAIHDGVRPLCSPALIKRCFDEAEKNNNAVPSISIAESMREVTNDKNSSVDRTKFRLIQTPQCFDSVLLKKAYQNTSSANFTDDAGVFEADGNNIHLIEGERNNIKITIKEDLVVAAALLEGKV